MRLHQWILAGALALVTCSPSQAQILNRPLQRLPYGSGIFAQRDYPLSRYQDPRYSMPNYQQPGYPMPMNQADGRRLWVYGSQGEGSFRQMDNGTWVESNYSGQYYYRELGRTPRFVDLFDANRNIFVRIQDGMMYSHGMGAYRWNPGYVGHWE